MSLLLEQKDLDWNKYKRVKSVVKTKKVLSENNYTVIN